MQFGSHRLIASAALLGVILLVASCAGPIPMKDFDLEKMSEAIEKRADAVDIVRTEFTKTRSTNVFNRDMAVQGRLIMQKPNKFRLTLMGDTNVEVLSDGKVVHMIHDLCFHDTYRMHGERDLARFADPLMTLLQGISSGALRKYAVVNRVAKGDSVMLEVVPGNGTDVERINRAFLWFGSGGELKRIRIFLKDGAVDDTVFTLWAILAPDDPEIVFLNRSLQELAVQKDSSMYDLSRGQNCCAARSRGEPEIIPLRRPPVSTLAQASPKTSFRSPREDRLGLTQSGSKLAETP